MEIKITVWETINDEWFISVGELRTDNAIAEYLCLQLKTYRNTLISKYNAHRSTSKACNGEIFFKSEQDAQNAINNFIMPRAVASRLGGIGRVIN
jgi:hypothetical protein